jgi:hypothetical protein
MQEGLKQKIWNILISWRKEWLGTTFKVDEDASLLDLEGRLNTMLDEVTKQIQERKEIAEKYLDVDDYRVRHKAEHEVEVFKWVLAVLDGEVKP